MVVYNLSTFVGIMSSVDPIELLGELSVAGDSYCFRPCKITGQLSPAVFMSLY